MLVCILGTVNLYWPSLGRKVLASGDSPVSSGDLAETYRRVSPSVVSIEVEIGFLDDAGGTGFVVDKYGHIVTNAHVVEDARYIRVVFHDGSRTSAALIGMDTRADIAVIKVNVASRRLAPVTYGNSDVLAIGQSVLAIGNPFGLEATLTTGIISGLKREIEFDDGSVLEGMIQTDAAIAPGSSGGPLLTLNGDVIGVNSAGVGARFGGTNFGFAIPSNAVKRISERMIAVDNDSRRARSIRPVSTPTRRIRPSPTRFVTNTKVPTWTALPTLELSQAVEEEFPTSTSEPDVIVVRATIPTPLLPPTADETEIAELLATPPPRPTEPATWTPAPNVSPTQDVGFVFDPTPSDATPPAVVGVRALPPTPMAMDTDLPTVTSQPTATSPPTLTRNSPTAETPTATVAPTATDTNVPSEFAPGQQLRMLRDLNIRQQATTSSPVVGTLDPGDYVAILAGPHRESRYEWWQVQTANDIVGWIAAKIDGQPTVQRQ